MSPIETLAYLDRQNEHHIETLHKEPVWAELVGSSAEPEKIRAILRGLMLQVHGYGASVMQAMGAALGRLAAFPPLLPLAGPIAAFLKAEIEHPSMAFEGYVKELGGSPEKRFETAPPSAFVLGHIARALAEDHHPLAFLGMMYMFECTTAQLAPAMADSLKARKIEVQFLTVHAEEDEGHAAALRALISRAVEADPAAADAIVFGQQCFAITYPLPVWRTALAYAESEGKAR